MAYAEYALGATNLWKEPDVTLARLKFDRLRTPALGPFSSPSGTGSSTTDDLACAR
jgi:hypothetical protein